MLEFNKGGNKDILEVLRQQKRLNLKRVNNFSIVEENLNDISFLEWYVFRQMQISPSNFLANLETQYYAEQNFRDRRQRNIEFVRGRQFNEPVYDSELQRWVPQSLYLSRRGIPLLTYNVISKLVRSLTGQFSEINTGNVVTSDNKDDRGSELANILTKCVERIKKNNSASSKDAENYKEMLLSGSPVFKIRWGTGAMSNTIDLQYRNVNRALFMVNPGIVDYDMQNLHTATEIHNTSLNDIIKSFANGNHERGMSIKQGYINYQGDELKQSSYSSQSWDGSQLRNNTFHTQGTGNSSYRYYETWREICDYEAITFDPLDGVGTKTYHKWKDPKVVRKEMEVENADRKVKTEGMGFKDEDLLITMDVDFVTRWYVIFMTPWGLVLGVRESPYKSGMHPFIFPPPNINGEQWGIVEEVLNAQLGLDRQISQADAIISNASKGMWLVPDTAVPDTHTNKEYLTELKKTNGAVIYKVREGYEKEVPEQVYANSTNVSNGVDNLIQMYSGLVDDISGNYGAAQGKTGGSGKTATGYALESQNAGLNIRNTVDTFFTVLVRRDDKLLQGVIEGYTKQDYKRITGTEVDPQEIKQFEFYTEQSKGTNSPAHKFALEQELLQLVRDELIPFEVFAEVSSNPMLKRAIQKWEELKEKQATDEQAAAQQGGQPTPAPQQGSPFNNKGEMTVDPMLEQLGSKVNMKI